MDNAYVQCMDLKITFKPILLHVFHAYILFQCLISNPFRTPDFSHCLAQFFTCTICRKAYNAYSLWLQIIYLCIFFFATRFNGKWLKLKTNSFITWKYFFLFEDNVQTTLLIHKYIVQHLKPPSFVFSYSSSWFK